MTLIASALHAHNNVVTILKVDLLSEAKILAAIFGGKRVHRNPISNIERRFRHATPAQIARRRIAKRIGGDIPVVSLHVDINVHVRINPFELRNRTLYSKYLVEIKLGGDGMMRGSRDRH